MGRNERPAPPEEPPRKCRRGLSRPGGRAKTFVASSESGCIHGIDGRKTRADACHQFERRCFPGLGFAPGTHPRHQQCADLFELAPGQRGPGSKDEETSWRREIHRFQGNDRVVGRRQHANTGVSRACGIPRHCQPCAGNRCHLHEPKSKRGTADGTCKFPIC